MSKEKTMEQIVRYICGTLIIIVGLVEILRIIGLTPNMGYDILKAIILLWAGIFVAFYSPSNKANK